VEKIMLIGAGGMCKEVISLIRDINEREKRYEICGILDDNPEFAGRRLYGYRVLGPVVKDGLADSYKAVLCIATHRDIGLRAAITERLGLEKERWARIIHPQATVDPEAELDYGVILYPGCRVGPDTRMGLNSFLYYNAVLHHDSRLGDFTQVCAGVMIAGYVTVGKRCYLGIGSVIRDNITLADDTMVGMGAVVARDITEPGSVVKGVPARRA